MGTPPSLTVISPIQNEVYTEGSPITFEATVSDNEDQPTAIGLSWDVDGTVLSTTSPDSTGTATFDDSSLSPGSHTLTLTATDSAGLYATDVVSFSVNGTPTAPTVEITPDPADTTNTLTASLTAPSTDPEGASIGYSYVWLKNNVIQGSQTAQSISGSDTVKGDQWIVRVTPNDGMVDGPFGEASITVQNTAPSISSLLLTPAFGSYNDIVYSCSPLVSDPDETPTVSYEWILNGAPYGGNASTLDLSGSGAMPNDSLSCTVTATDSDGATDSMNSGDIIITNRWPTLSNLAIAPNSNVTSSTSLTCSADVTDDDGETVTASFQWTVGVNTYSGATLDLDTVSVSPGDQVTCDANATDAYGGYDNDLGLGHRHQHPAHHHRQHHRKRQHQYG